MLQIVVYADDTGLRAKGIECKEATRKNQNVHRRGKTEKVRKIIGRTETGESICQKVENFQYVK